MLKSKSSCVLAALIAEQAETRELCAFAASSIVSNASSTCGSRGAIAAAFAAISDDAVSAMLRGRETKC